MTARKSGLGRGLEALIPTSSSEGAATGFSLIPVDRIEVNPDQPRSRFDAESLDELTASIRELGVLQPIVVETTSGGYRLVAGERRWRAAKRAGLPTIPAVIRESTGDHTLVEALVENVQRADLTPVEEARAYKQLLEEYGMSQAEVAKRVGKSRPTISNTLRLLSLPTEVQAMVEDGRLTGGHVRALVGLEDQKFGRYLADRAVAEGWSVRQMEDAVRARREMESGEDDEGPTKVRTIRPVEIIELEKRLADKLDSKVEIKYKNQKGRVEIRFGSVQELERLYRIITG